MPTHPRGIVMLVLSILVCGCPESRPSDPAASEAASNAAELGQEGDPSELEPNPVYPIVVSIEGNEPLQDSAVVAEEISEALDDACAGLDISPALATSRPNGTGCPRENLPAHDDPSAGSGQ